MNNPEDPNDKTIYCDLCCLTPRGELKWRSTAGVAKWDAPTRDGPWGYICEEHKYAAYVGDQYLLKSWRKPKE